MKITAFGALCASLVCTGLAAAQQPAPAPQAKPMMMMSQNEDVTKLVERLQNSFAILENEKDPALLKKELAEHGALLKDLEAKAGGEKKEMCCKGMKKDMKGEDKAAAEEAKPDPHAEHHH